MYVWFLEQRVLGFISAVGVIISIRRILAAGYQFVVYC